MTAYQFHLLAQVEDRHWWHRVLRRAVTRALTEFRDGHHLSVLDVGCGTGGLASELAGDHRVFGLDLSTVALDYARGRGLTRLVRGTMEALPFPDGFFDVLTSIDSITVGSVASDHAALREHARVLRPGGLLILQVSAFRWLRGNHDVETHLQRRYTKAEVRELLEDAGLRVLSERYRLSFLPPLMLANNWIVGSLRNREARPDMEIPFALGNQLLHGVARLDLALGSWSPMGSSVFCVAEKP